MARKMESLDQAENERLRGELNAWIVKRNAWPQLGASAAAEVKRFYADHANVFETGSMGSSEEKATHTAFRNDERCWLTPKLCETHQLLGTLALIKALIKWCVTNVKQSLKLNADYSIQLSRFAGSGARYVRHRDTFLDSRGLPTSGSKSQTYRKLTMIYYLNETCDGGKLRIYDSSGDGYVEIEPLLSTFVVFRSEFVEHEVLPSHLDRFAIAIWVSSDIPYVTSQGLSRLLDRSQDQSWLHPLSLAVHRHTGDPEDSTPMARDIDSQHFRSKRIFVSIANYRDSQGPLTIIDLFAKARHPARIHVGHLLQADPIEDRHCFLSDDMIEAADTLFNGIGMWLRSNVRTQLKTVAESTGPCLARHLCIRSLMSEDDDYLLQIDSHMRIRPNWDEYLIDLLELIKSDQQRTAEHQTCKPVLTTYPWGYTLPNHVPSALNPTVLRPYKFDADGLLRQRSHVVQLTANNGNDILYLRSPLWAAGFSFSDAQMLREVPYSPCLPGLFFGEEISMAARLFTHGYDFYAPATAVAYHLYSRQHRQTFNQAEKDESRISLVRQASQEVVRHMLTGAHRVLRDEIEAETLLLLAENKSNYWLGHNRDLQAFEHFVSVRFASQELVLTIPWEEKLLPEWTQIQSETNTSSRAVVISSETMTVDELVESVLLNKLHNTGIVPSDVQQQIITRLKHFMN